MNKKHVTIATSVVVLTWIASGIYVFNGLKKIREETAKDEAAGAKAQEIMLDRVRKGMYRGKTSEDIHRDYHFFKIAERLEEVQ